jgi:hypothetical protein
MSKQTFAELLKALISEGEKATAHLPKPIAFVWVSKDGQSIDICLDNTKDTYSEWIKGEGADIALIRDRETHMVVGAHLPLYAKSLIVGGDEIPTADYLLE